MDARFSPFVQSCSFTGHCGRRGTVVLGMTWKETTIALDMRHSVRRRRVDERRQKELFVDRLYIDPCHLPSYLDSHSLFTKCTIFFSFRPRESVDRALEPVDNCYSFGQKQHPYTKWGKAMEMAICLSLLVRINRHPLQLDSVPMLVLCLCCAPSFSTARIERLEIGRRFRDRVSIG